MSLLRRISTKHHKIVFCQKKNRYGRDVNAICLFKTKCNDMQRQMFVDKVRENISVFENWDMKTEWGTELRNCCNMTEMRECTSD